MAPENPDSPPKQVLIVARSLTAGGAAIAAGRLVQALNFQTLGRVRIDTITQSQPSIDSDTPVTSFTNQLRIACPAWLAKALRIMLRFIYGFGHRAPSDYGVVGFGRVKRLPVSASRLVHLHWIGDGDLSLREIAQLPRPVVWTMHDMWTFLGAERYSLTNSYVDGYRTNHSEPPGRQLVNRLIFLLKRKLWTQPMTLVAPSSWIAERAKLSPITRSWPIHVIPNPLNTEFWFPGSREEFSATLSLPRDKWIILFGAVDPLGDHNKGADLLHSALAHLRESLSEQDTRRIHLAVFGSGKGANDFGVFPVSFLGTLDEEEMRKAYRSANVVAIPSRLENLPQVGTEAAACGVPVVAFNTCGLPDVVVDEETGLLVEPFDTRLMAAAIKRLFKNPDMCEQMGVAARKRAETLWSYPVVAEQYLDLYSSLVRH